MKTVVEGARGCGFRKPGGLYLVAPALSESCPRLPLETHACPTCGGGIHPARGWTWIVPVTLFGLEAHGTRAHSMRCPLGIPGLDPGHDGVRAGLLWIGESFYPTPRDFIEEAAAMGVSRRIAKVPKGFVVGETFVFMGHRKGKLPTRLAIGEESEFRPAIVSVFRPTAIEYVVTGDETDEELAKLQARGIEPVKVIPASEQASAFPDAAE